MKRYVQYRAEATKNIESLCEEFDSSSVIGNVLTSEYLTTTKASPKNYVKSIEKRLSNWKKFGFSNIKILNVYDK